MIDSDGHIIENLKEIFEYFESPYAGGLAIRNGLAQGHGLWPQLDGWPRQMLQARTGATTAWVSSADEWVRVLDETGIELTVLYPTVALSHGLIRDVEWSIALARAYNSWIADRYQAVDRRLRFVALLPLHDPVAAAAELERAVVELGAQGGVMAAAGLPEALGAPGFAPLYAKAEELDVPLVVHGAPAAVLPDLFDRFSHIHVLAHPYLQMMSMTSMFKAGVFDKFTKLRVGFFEAGASWVPFLVSRLDRTTSILGHEQYEVYQGDGPPRVPSDVIREGRVFFSVEGEEPLIGAVLDDLGAQCLCFASDFPHEQGNAKEVLHEADELRERDDLSDEQRAAVFRDNALLLYGERLLA